MPVLLLASQSPRRRELLTLLGLPFDLTIADIEETPGNGARPAALAARLSREKAQAVDGDADPIIVACDTVVALDDEILGKPRDAAEAAEMLRRLRDCVHHAVYSAITLRDGRSGRLVTDVAETQIAMRPYTDEELAAYVASGDPLDKAGAYAIQHPGFHPVAVWDGCYANVVGLPLCHLARALQAWGVPVTRNVPAACQAHTGQVCAVYGEILDEK
ncbi:MAG TPA: septum formation protein Maf [Chloroflexi bacterium]|nr:septum formation protein Maf [Chloroflexota bacterium]